jgi:hypothetical protein
MGCTQNVNLQGAEPQYFPHQLRADSSNASLADAFEKRPQLIHPEPWTSAVQHSMAISANQGNILESRWCARR